MDQITALRTVADGGSESVIVFVYGTLRRGEKNHALLASATYLGAARTRPEFELIDLGGYPGMADGGSCAVLGELYLVEPNTLVSLDALERHPDWYLRRPIVLALGESAVAYILPRKFCAGGRAILGGDWIARDRIP